MERTEPLSQGLVFFSWVMGLSVMGLSCLMCLHVLLLVSARVFSVLIPAYASTDSIWIYCVQE